MYRYRSVLINVAVWKEKQNTSCCCCCLDRGLCVPRNALEFSGSDTRDEPAEALNCFTAVRRLQTIIKLNLSKEREKENNERKELNIFSFKSYFVLSSFEVF